MCFDDFSAYNEAMDGDDFQNFSDREAWEDSQAEIDRIDEECFDQLELHEEFDLMTRPNDYDDETPLGHELEGE